MSENPYQAPAADALPRFELRSYHVPFIIAVACGVALAVLFASVPRPARFAPQHGVDFFAVCFGVLFAVLVFAILVCGFVMFDWWRTGKPPELTLEPLFDGPETRALRRAWKERPQLDDEEFYRTFYADSGIASPVVASVRREMESILGWSLAGIHPCDEIEIAAPELDLADVFYRFEKDLKITIPGRTGEVIVDGTFDSLVRLVAEHLK